MFAIRRGRLALDEVCRDVDPGIESQLRDVLEQVGWEAVEEIVPRANEARATTEAVVRHGVPHEEILEYVRETDVGLTVVGSKNRSSEYRRLLGSVAERVVHMSDRPVTVVKTPVGG